MGRAAVRELDAIMRNVFREDEATLAEWESVSRVERPARHAGEEPPADGAPSAQG